MSEEKNISAPKYGNIIHVCGLNAVDETLTSAGATHLVTLINSNTMIDTPSNIKPELHLRLAMNDISQPQTNLVQPAEIHIEELISFIDRWEQKTPMLIHCWAGISRSTAATYIALCFLNPDTPEHYIANTLRDASATACPNRLMIELGDRLLSRNGRMVEAIDDIGRGELATEGKAFSLPSRLSAILETGASD